MVFRRDRIACTRGADRLRGDAADRRLEDPADDRRLLRDADVPGLRRQAAVGVGVPRPFGPDAPPVEMRICTLFRRSDDKAEDGVPSHPGYPPAMIVRILAAWPLMLFSRPVAVLP